MSGTPTPKSYEQILGDMISTYTSKVGVNDLNTGSVQLSFFESVAQAIYRASGDNFSILREFDVDRAGTEKLKRIAADENIVVQGDKVATGTVTITDTSFEKIVTKVYAGANPPNIGSTIIRVSDASLFEPTGSVYIGRGTPNVEGPLDYSSIVQVGGFYEITLVNPTTKFHNISESVIFAQGGVRTISSGEVVQSPSSGTSPDINFTLTQQAIILDGEVSISGVAVAAQEPGADGNVPANSIKRFSSAPFTGAVVTNVVGFTTGKNADTDEEIRNNIKRARISRGLGTSIAVRNSVLGAQAQDENATVTSNEIFSDGETTTLFIDNGNGYEQSTQGVGLEFIVDSALGGERFFQLATGGIQTSVAKAFLSSVNTSPYAIAGNDRLSLLVGGNLSEHAFQSTDFRSPNNATAFEVVASINANSNISFSARTIEDGTRVTVFARTEEDEFIQKTLPTVGRDAGVAIGLPEGEAQTLKLFKNKKPISKNGRVASVTSEQQINWSNAVATGDTLVISADKTSSITYTFVDADFLSEGTHPTVNRNNSLQSWVNVINTKVTGITASINGNRLVLTSNLGATSRASVIVDPSSGLVSKGVFTASQGLTAEGREADFTLSRNTAQFKLKKPLEKGDSLTSGTEFTKGSVESLPILSGIVTLPSDGYIWVLIDNQDATTVNTGVTADTSLTVSKPATNVVRYTSNNPTAFSNVEVGDWLILWSEELSVGNRLEGRVSGTSGEYVELTVTPTEFTASTAQGPIVWQEGISIVRTQFPVQKVKIDSGTYNINTVATILRDSIIGASTSVEDDQILSITTETEDQTGEIFIVTFNDSAKGLSLSENQRNSSENSLFAFYENESEDDIFPLFVNGLITSDRPADPPNSLIGDFDSSIDLSASGIDPNANICMLHPFSTVQDNASDNECVQIDSITGLSVNVNESQLVRRVRANDRFYVADTYQLSAEDVMTLILDGDASNKTFPISLFRRAIANNTAGIDTNNWRAFDTDSGSTAEFQDFFGVDFNFKNYRALMKAKNVIDPIKTMVAQDSLLFRSVEWGKAGERLNVGYTYPTSANQEIVHTVSVDTEVLVRISLKSGNAIANTIDGTTEWDVTITSFAGFDEVTYTHSGTGTNPTIAAALSSGGYVTINGNGEFSIENQGTFRVSSATATSFTVIRETGSALAENDIATLTNTTVVLFENNDTTADEINTYVADNVSDFITSEIINDAGLAGSGVISRSTEEDSNFTYKGVRLLDGMNWVEVSDLDSTAPNYQFRFKKALDLPSFSTGTANAYAFNAGEEVRLIPTTARQVVDFMNTLAVTGFTTLGDITTSSRERRVQFKTEVLGSNGAVQIAGGNANSAAAQVLQAASRIAGSDLIKATIPRSASGGFHVDQWVKLTASEEQKKNTGMSFITTVSMVGNSPLAGQSTITLGNIEDQDNYFGESRNFFRDSGRTFHVEKHGSLVCISWDGNGDDPIFNKSVEINDDASVVSVERNLTTGFTEYTVESGNVNFIESQKGDLLTVSGFTNETNNGSFDVVAVSEDGSKIVVDNTLSIGEASVSLPLASFSVSAEISEGDSLVVSDGFEDLNKGTYRIIRRYNNSVYIDNPNAVEEIVTISANNRSLGFDGTTEFDVVATSGLMRVEHNGTGTIPTMSEAKYGDTLTLGSDFDVDNQGSFMVVESGIDYVVCANSKAVGETGILITDVLESHKPSLVFSEYETTIVGDRFVVSGNVFGGDNVGSYNVLEVLNKNSIVVQGVLVDKTTVQLEERFTQVYVEEFLPYTAYKKIYNKSVDPNNADRSCIVFDTDSQFLKINRDAGEVNFSAVGKLGFNTAIRKGFDSYRYETGLIAESNRIVYGDPRDNVTYPGVAAAGAEIFIEPPLIRRIEVGVGVRVNTGIPFSRVTEQARNNIAALVNSNSIGQSIAISDIVAVVNSIPGVSAVSVTSPTYDINNDVIVVNPSEKALILDIVNDITISKVG